MMEWTGQVGWATVFAAASLGATAFVAIKGLGMREGDSRRLAQQHADLEATVKHLRKEHGDEITALRREKEAFMSACNASVAIQRDALIEFQRDVAQAYPTKEDLRHVEERTSKGLDHLSGQLDKIDTRMETIGDMVMKALSERRPAA